VLLLPTYIYDDPIFYQAGAAAQSEDYSQEVAKE